MTEPARVAPAPLPDAVRASLRQTRATIDAGDAWRARTLNLIASENVLSPAARSVLDSDFLHRYAEGHPGARYYEGTKFIDAIETDAAAACRRVFRAGWADVRPVSGTVSNEAVFARLVPRGATAIAHKVATGGHISHDRMGSLGKRTDKILPWPTQADGYRIDVDAAKDLIAREKPALVTFGRSLFLFPEPVAELADACKSVNARVLFDGAHVLGLIAGGCFQDPLREGADVMTGSTHKTFFGPQRGVVLTRGDDEELRTAVDRGVFPGATSNHHLFSLPAMLVATLEVETFGARYARDVVANAQAFARALAKRGLPPAFEASGFTQSHQVAVDVSAHGGGREVATRLAGQDVICNMNLLPGEPGKNAMNPKGLRLGVQELTRYGMGPAEMDEAARLLVDAVVHRKDVTSDVKRLRARFPTVQYAFAPSDLR
ncbi:MAG: serine hydroxymethyltransferase [Planctomycetota bacterium]